ncbi:PD-(D/E)XK nuclease family transposase, partial [Candidatus Trichorickettsia mobilis]|uniref:PD-(D/E)XK nuclease family transposase n=1 Tax=Candidatus Trichorickettsia mobilis TaxID=1346319 RepID=UPI002B263BFE
LKDFYFTFIELPKFTKTKIEELGSIIEKWCFFFKYASKTSEADLEKLIGSDLVIKTAYEALNQFNWSETELIAYEQELKRVRDNIAALEYQIDQAEARGEARGKEEIAKKMLSQNWLASDISAITGLSSETIAKLSRS